MDEIRISGFNNDTQKSIERFLNTFVIKGDTGDTFISNYKYNQMVQKW